jgi:conjugative transfer signal peptidase TraF
MTRRGWFFVTYFAVLGTGVSLVVHPVPRLIWNETASVPVGLYRLRPEPAPHVGDLIAVHLPRHEAMLLATRSYLPLGVPLLKPVAAVAGQTVCSASQRITIDGKFAGDAQSVDHRGRPLPVWQGCRHLASGEVFVMNPAEPRSLDGRYFGVLSLSTVIGRATPVWLPSGSQQSVNVIFNPSSKGQ